MSRVVLYQGYTITSYPVHESESGQWQLNIVISGEEEGSTFSRSYWMPLTYPTETEADIAGVTFGQRIIDGKVSGISVDKLSHL